MQAKDEYGPFQNSSSYQNLKMINIFVIGSKISKRNAGYKEPSGHLELGREFWAGVNDLEIPASTWCSGSLLFRSFWAHEH